VRGGESGQQRDPPGAYSDDPHQRATRAIESEGSTHVERRFSGYKTTDTHVKNRNMKLIYTCAYDIQRYKLVCVLCRRYLASRKPLTHSLERWIG